MKSAETSSYLPRQQDNPANHLTTSFQLSQSSQPQPSNQQIKMSGQEYYSGASMESNNGGGQRNDDYDSDDENMQSATRHAERNAGSHGSADMFSSIISSLAGNKQSVAQQPIDEQRMFPFLPSFHLLPSNSSS